MKPEPGIDAALGFIAGQQEADGGFSSLSSPSQHKFNASGIKYRTTFSASLILAALNNVSNPKAADIKQRTAQYLLRQKSSQWSYNYWDRQSPESVKRPYPDDLDDTFNALYALQSFKPDLIDATASAHIAHILIHCESQPGGPYTTWLVPKHTPEKWHDVDPAVNANIAAYLSLINVKLPNIDNLLIRMMQTETLSSPYYPTNFPLIYFLCRDRSLSKTSIRAARRLLFHGQNDNGYWENELCTALAITSLLRLGTDIKKLERAVTYLQKRQLQNGSWRAYAFCVDPANNSRTYYNGSKALTTAFCIEALTLCRTAEVASNGSNIRNQTIRSMELDVSELPRDLAMPLRQTLQRLEKLDQSHQITSMPRLVQDAYSGTVAPQKLLELSQLSAWGWMAYTVFDDFLDGTGKTSNLPMAMYCIRQLQRCIDRLPTNDDFQEWAQRIITRIDAANAWEQMNCRGSCSSSIFSIAAIPDYGSYWQLADRSIGHVIAGAGVLHDMGSGINPSRFRSYELFMTHFLIARQLQDDLTDWYDDAMQGHCNSVFALILQAGSKHQTKSGLVRCDLIADKSGLLQCFWSEAVPAACKLIQDHLALAQQAMDAMQMVSPRVFTAMVERVDQVAKDTLQTREDSLHFASQFRTPAIQR